LGPAQMREVRIVDEIVVDVLPPVVWAAIEDPVAHAEWHPFVTRIGGEHRIGASRTCELDLGKRTGRTRERCIAHEAERRIAWKVEEDSTGFLRLVSDCTVGFDLRPDGSGETLVAAESALRPRSLLVWPLMPMVRRKFHDTQRKLLTALKEAAERSATGTQTAG
jgi:Polyketide cyclase / dehydrase and lipid transport